MNIVDSGCNASIAYRDYGGSIMDGVSAIWLSGLWGTGGGCPRGVVGCAPGGCRGKALLSAIGAIATTEVDIISEMPGVSTHDLVKEGRLFEGKCLKMDTRMLQEQRLKTITKSKTHKVPVPPRGLCWNNAKAKTRARTVAG